MPNASSYAAIYYFPRSSNIDLLLIEPNNRAYGMGNAFVALADDATVTWCNLLFDIKLRQVSALR